MPDLELEQAQQRIEVVEEAASLYVEELSSIRNDLDNGTTGTTLGVMVGAQIRMTESETKYAVTAGIPKKISSAVQAAANDVKKSAG
jgi:hypothetical protein